MMAPIAGIPPGWAWEGNDLVLRLDGKGLVGVSASTFGVWVAIATAWFLADQHGDNATHRRRYRAAMSKQPQYEPDTQMRMDI